MTNTDKSLPAPVSPGAIRLELTVPVPVFKNRKRIVGKRLFTEKKVKARMLAIINAIESQLLCALERDTAGILTDAPALSWIRSSLPLDDCWTCIPELIVTAELAPDDGATITIERL